LRESCADPDLPDAPSDSKDLGMRIAHHFLSQERKYQAGRIDQMPAAPASVCIATSTLAQKTMRADRDVLTCETLRLHEKSPE
jgi:hypothetical protein